MIFELPGRPPDAEGRRQVGHRSARLSPKTSKRRSDGQGNPGCQKRDVSAGTWNRRALHFRRIGSSSLTSDACSAPGNPGTSEPCPDTCRPSGSGTAGDPAYAETGARISTAGAAGGLPLGSDSEGIGPVITSSRFLRWPQRRMPQPSSFPSEQRCCKKFASG